jgi:hypothetical protein
MNLHERIAYIENSQASDAVSIAEQLGYGWALSPARRRGGGEVIDLSNSHAARRRTGGHHPMARQVLSKWSADGPVMVGHTTSYADPDAPILVREQDIVTPQPGIVGYIEGRCEQCIARPTIARDGGEMILILEHEPGCPVMAGLLRDAGAGS